MTKKVSKDYLENRYPYHVEMLSSYEINDEGIKLYFERGTMSEFSFSDIDLSKEEIKERFKDQIGKIMYIYQDPESNKDMAVELINLTGCCAGIRKMLIG